MTRTTDHDPLLGRVLDGKFTLQSVLGRGGMGVVYRAYQKSLERSVALKLMRGFSGEEDAAEREAEFQRRFFLEAATSAKLKHPNTITIFDYGSSIVDGERVFYITMELLDGTTLSKLLQNDGPLAPLRAVSIALQICRSLREAHVAGIVHRDLKPGNVMIIKNDEDDDVGDFVKVLDFGLAKSRSASASNGQQLTRAGTFLGSPRYVAPEQIESRPVDGRADIYALGCVLYRMLTGRVPFDGEQAVEVMMKHLNDPVPPLQGDDLLLPDSLERLVLRCLQKDPEARPASMDDVISELKRVRGELGGVYSGNLTIPETLRERLRAEQASAASATVRPPSAEKAPPSRATTTAATESTSPSSVSTSASASLTNSGEWQFNGDISTSSERPGRLTVPRKPRRIWPSIAAGMLVGLAVALLFAAERTGTLQAWLAPWRAPGSDSLSERPASKTKATSATKATLLLKSTPTGADVFELTDDGERLMGITPLTLPWEVAVGDPGRDFVLKKQGFVSSRASVVPPEARATGEPARVDVEASLRPWDDSSTPP